MNKKLMILLAGSVVAFMIIVIVTAVCVSKSSKHSSGTFASVGSGGDIGIVEIKGIIKDSKRELERINELKESKSIKAILVRIDSPGGVVGPSQEIYEALTKVTNKPVVASLGAVAASGGYYIAVGAKKIVSNPGTLTGSVGVIMEQVNLQKLYEYIKVKRFALKAGKYKDAGSEFRELTEEEKVLFQTTLDDTHMQFKEAVAKGRNMTIAEVEKFADGRVVTGRQALKLKMVDALGNFDDAVELTAKEAGIKGKPKLVYAPKNHNSIFSMLMDTQSEDMEEIFDRLISSKIGNRLLYQMQ